MKINGSCHCGNISFALDWEPKPREIAARACSCSFCRKHGGVWTSNPQGRLRVVVKDPAQVSHYAFGTRTADFHICAKCGAVPLVTSDIEGTRYAVVSVNAFDNVPAELLKPGGVSFDGESESDRLARRQRGWIRDVEISPAV